MRGGTRIRRVAGATLAAVVATAAAVVAPPAAAVPGVARLAGGDAAATAAMVSQAGWASSTEAVVVAASGWTDALAATALGLPLLLAGRDVLPQATREELRRLGARRVWVVGGTDAVGRSVRDELRQSGMTVTDVAGADRYETAARLAEASALAASTRVIVASGESWSDAASIAAWAAASRTPIVLTRRDALPETSREALRNASAAIVVGGGDVVSDRVAAEVPSPTRLWGNDRYDTNAAVVEWASMHGLGLARPVLAPGTSPMDALVAGPLAARRASSVLLTPPGRLPIGAQHVVVQTADRVESLAVVAGSVQIADGAVADATAALAAADLFAWVNEYRARNGRGPLTRDGDQTERAFAHARALSVQGRLFHQAAQCTTWGENVGTGSDPRAVFDAWIGHSAHRAVVLMGSVTRAGTAVVTGDDGRRWVVLDVCA